MGALTSIVKDHSVQKTSHQKKTTPFFSSLPIQRKLSIGAPDDPYEVEADRIADHVVSAQEFSSPPSPPLRGSLIQRKCSTCNHEEELQKKPLAEGISTLIQRVPSKSSGESVATNQITQKINQSKGGGSLMSEGTRGFMENRFGADFSTVKIHTDSTAIQMSRDLNAQAFTVGNDVYFNEGKYNPSSTSGKHLLAHELTHTIQQGGIQRKLIQRSTTRGAGGCGPLRSVDEDLSGARGAGRIAHTQIQTFLLSSAILNELEVPRATKQNMSPSCAPASRREGFADLWKPGAVIGVGEIKPVGFSETYGVPQSEHYVRRARQSMDRKWSTGSCRAHLADTKDNMFAGTIGNNLMLSRTRFTKLRGVFPVDTTIGPFDGDRSRTLKAKLTSPGAVGYWCTGGASNTFTCGASDQEMNDFLDQALVPAQSMVDAFVTQRIVNSLEQAITNFDVRTILRIAEREGLLSGLPFSVETLAEAIESSLGTTGRTILKTIARRIANIMLSELRTQIRNGLRQFMKNTLLALCVGAPAVSLAKLLNELEKNLTNFIRQLMPGVIIATVAVIEARIIQILGEAVRELLELLEPLGRILAAIAAAVLAIVAIIVAILAIIAIFDPVPGDEVGLAAVAAALGRIILSLSRFALRGAPRRIPAF